MHPFHRIPFALALGSLLLPAFAQQGPADDQTAAAQQTSHSTELETIEVRALPQGGTALDSTQPVDVLTGEQLDDRKEATLGETLQAELGIQSTYFGPGAGRPIVRGLGGSRVRITEDGLNSLDASALSPDHAVSAEPLLIDSIEILRGPANLMYGSTASAGVINLIDNRIPEQRQDFSGAVELRGNTVADEFAGVVRLDGCVGAFQFHVDGFYRDTSDIDIPGFALTDTKLAELEPEELAKQERGKLRNSALETSGGTFGFSFVDAWGYAGFAYKLFDTTYGIPAELEEEESEPGAAEEEAGGISIDLDQNRYEFKTGLYTPFAGMDEISIKFVSNDYQHVELEGDEVGTTFNIDANELRLELDHASFGLIDGVIGVQFEDTDLEAIGLEAFIPANNTESLGIFLIEELDLDPVKLSAGFRHQDDEVNLRNGFAVDGISQRDFTAITLSTGGLWRFAEQWQASINWTRSERSPTAEELFADGPHVATQAFEIGDPTLTEETSNNFDIGVHKYLGKLHLRADVFYNDIDDFVFLANTEEIDDGLPVQVWSQQDAEFYGVETEASYLFADTPIGSIEWRVFHDSVQAELNDNSAIPRLSPSRIGTGIDWHNGNWRANIDFYHVNGRNDVAGFETTTPGYNNLSANIVYRLPLPGANFEVFVKGQNLTDEVQRVHTSFLKDFAPRPGINLAGGIRGYF